MSETGTYTRVSPEYSVVEGLYGRWWVMDDRHHVAADSYFATRELALARARELDVAFRARMSNGDRLDKTGNVPSEDCEQPASDYWQLDESPLYSRDREDCHSG
jgi:hypothetical protein